MGREIRRVPMGWKPPKKMYTRLHGQQEEFQPQHDRSFLEEAREWMDEAKAWDAGTHEDAAENKAAHPFYWQWAGDPPDPQYYRPDWASLGLEPTGYAVYETVSEGTPVTPTFATKEELIDHLVKHGDAWDERRGSGGWKRENAESFVERGSAVSLIVETSPEGRVSIKGPKDQ
jgi:hypothetical protein